MTYQEILAKKGADILITGDSLAYNFQHYDECPRGFAYHCGVGMGAWSFKLRDRIYTSDPQFVYGNELQFDCKAVDGIANESEVPNTAMFGGKIKTLYPEGDVSFTAAVENDEIALYLQRRIDAPCTFDITVDGVLAAKDVDTRGHMEDFAGYGLMQVYLPCFSGRKEHTVRFTNIRGTSPVITVAGVGAKRIQIVLNGQGGAPTRFYIDHFEERIRRYSPDLIILSLSANDRIRIAPDMLRQNLIELFAKIFQCAPNCKVLFLLPPSSHDPLDPMKDVTPYTALDTAEVYNRTIRRVCERLGKENYGGFGTKPDAVYDIDTLEMSSFLDNGNVTEWRFDNIHLNRRGNEALLEAVSERLGL